MGESMSMHDSVYPDILFHFTSQAGLYGIMQGGFRLSYARECIAGPTLRREFAAPMVSFCDLKLSELRWHMGQYGKFGIGLTKDWANRSGLNPVMYVNRDCHFADSFTSALNGIYAHLGKLNDESQAEHVSANYMKITDTYRYLKNYEGELERNGRETIPTYRFADEREWRYVPPLASKGIAPFVAKSNIDTRAKKEAYNKTLLGHELKYSPSDVKYLIVEKDADIGDLVEHIKVSYGALGKDERHRLISRILTSEQIARDM